MTPETDTTREHDIIVFGATGFVGKLTARYLKGAAPAGTRIALGGRSKDKLERVRVPTLASTGRSSSPTPATRDGAGRPRRLGDRGGDDGRPLPEVRPPARRRLRSRGHALRRPHRRGAVHARPIDNADAARRPLVPASSTPAASTRSRPTSASSCSRRAGRAGDLGGDDARRPRDARRRQRRHRRLAARPARRGQARQAGRRLMFDPYSL